MESLLKGMACLKRMYYIRRKESKMRGSRNWWVEFVLGIEFHVKVVFGVHVLWNGCDDMGKEGKFDFLSGTLPSNLC